MDARRIQELYGYNRWANGRALAAASRLTAEQLMKDVGSSFRSVRDTLAHILGAEWIWLMRWNSTSPRALLSPTEFPSVAALEARWAEVETGQRQFLDSLTDESLTQPLAYVNTKGQRWQYPLWQTLVHAVNHSTYHRGQVTTMLRQLGAEPVATDFLVCYDVGGKIPG